MTSNPINSSDSSTDQISRSLFDIVHEDDETKVMDEDNAVDYDRLKTSAYEVMSALDDVNETLDYVIKSHFEKGRNGRLQKALSVPEHWGDDFRDDNLFEFEGSHMDIDLREEPFAVWERRLQDDVARVQELDAAKVADEEHGNADGQGSIQGHQSASFESAVGYIPSKKIVSKWIEDISCCTIELEIPTSKFNCRAG
uniref:Uncharacterized protein n=1 Tax=Leptocylindrus danicus TaxID=163516 RepID=A0A7S2LPZ9_9STRA|mmetsp:Transcript_7704/g.11448  ORF Transcript_7704/g.11448 Transcript_7704/m.11448 type:complete len:198 (+) Transcript_7704:1107-1700(+)